MKFASLGSGSEGNATLVVSGDTHLLVDCGFTLAQLTLRLARLGLTPDAIGAVLVTHEHGDYIRGVGPLCRKYQLPVFLSSGTLSTGRLGKLPAAFSIEAGCEFCIESLQIQPVAVPHDAQQPLQFVFHSQNKKLGLLTDLGSLTEHVIHAYSHCDGLLVEANHDPIMLACGPYPASLKRRVGGQWGHLSNAQTAHLLRELDTSRLQRLVVGHISQTNNTRALAQSAITEVLPHLDIHFACQAQGFDWQHIQ